MTLTPSAARTFSGILGNAAGRYFGGGYRDVVRHLTPVIAADDPVTFTATSQLIYPQTWSVKSGGTLVPHLSSIDTLVLAAAATCDAAQAAYELTDADLAASWLTDVAISAGSHPDEDLTSIPVTIGLHSLSGTEHSRISADFSVGSLRGRLVIALPAPAVPRFTSRARPQHNPIDFYQGTFGTHTVDADDVRVADDCTSVCARAVVHAGSTGYGPTSLESAYAPTVSFVDALVGAAQLAQILLYDLDDVDRAASNTLWMRKLRLTAHTPVRPIDRAFAARMDVRRASTLTMGGRHWRSADLTLVDFGGISGGCLLAHALPQAGTS